MAGINRLGKAPPRPGTLRPPDPNRYRAVDFYSQDAEGDADYMRMVRDIENSQQQHGWLSGRGAFDKSDLLFLRDEEEKRRFQELQRREQERQQFAILKAKAESDLKHPSKEHIQLGKRNRDDKFMKPNTIRVKVKEKTKNKLATDEPHTKQSNYENLQSSDQEDVENPFQGLVDCYESEEEGVEEEKVEEDVLIGDQTKGLLPDPQTLFGTEDVHIDKKQKLQSAKFTNNVQSYLNETPEHSE